VFVDLLVSGGVMLGTAVAICCAVEGIVAVLENVGQLPTAKAVGLSLPLSKVMLSSARHWLVGRVGSDTPASR
jgi:hypothetical protein